MPEPASSTVQSHSRLIRVLAEITGKDFEASSRNFAERLGLLLGFSDSIVLADALKTPACDTAHELPDAEDIRSTFLRVRGLMVNFIVTSCRTDAANERLRWPVIEPQDGKVSVEPIVNFYMAHQREMELGIRALRVTVREAMTEATAPLRQLAQLDQVLEETLSVHGRRFLAAVPRLLEQRIDQPLQRDWQTDWQHALAEDICELLLAELELRLQPVLGLVEALNHEVSTYNE